MYCISFQHSFRFLTNSEARYQKKNVNNNKERFLTDSFDNNRNICLYVRCIIFLISITLYLIL